MSRRLTTRVTADVPTDDVQRLQKLADRIHSNKTTALVRAIRTADLLDDAAQSGARIILEAPDGSRRELILP